MNASKSNCKKVLPKILMVIGIVVAILFSVIAIILLTQKPVDLEISNVDITTIRDGAYAGSANNGVVKATVSVEISNGKIQNIMILDHEHWLGKPAEKIVDNIIEQQSLKVDAITSATYSSDTIRKAIENALRQGEQEWK